MIKIKVGFDKKILNQQNFVGNEKKNKGPPPKMQRKKNH